MLFVSLLLRLFFFAKYPEREEQSLLGNKQTSFLSYSALLAYGHRKDFVTGTAEEVCQFRVVSRMSAVKLQGRKKKKNHRKETV